MYLSDTHGHWDVLLPQVSDLLVDDNPSPSVFLGRFASEIIQSVTVTADSDALRQRLGNFESKVATCSTENRELSSTSSAPKLRRSDGTQNEAVSDNTPGT